MVTITTAEDPNAHTFTTTYTAVSADKDGAGEYKCEYTFDEDNNIATDGVKISQSLDVHVHCES